MRSRDCPALRPRFARTLLNFWHGRVLGYKQQVVLFFLLCVCAALRCGYCLSLAADTIAALDTPFTTAIGTAVRSFL